MTSSEAAVAPDAGVIYETLQSPRQYADAYNDLMALPSNRLRVRAVAGILRHIDTPIARVVDVASGGGAYVDAARSTLGGDPRFFPMDRQYACVGGYRLNHPETAGALADVTALPVRPGSFDLAMCLDIIEHLDDDVAFLRGIESVLKPGGWIVVSTHNSRSVEHVIGLLTSKLRGKRWLGWDPTHVRFYDASSLMKKLAAAGFDTISFEGTYYLPFHLPARILSWPLDRLGLRRASKFVYDAIAAPGYALNYVFEACSGLPLLRTCGWGIVVLARRR